MPTLSDLNKKARRDPVKKEDKRPFASITSIIDMFIKQYEGIYHYLSLEDYAQMMHDKDDTHDDTRGMMLGYHLRNINKVDINEGASSRMTYVDEIVDLSKRWRFSPEGRDTKVTSGYIKTRLFFDFLPMIGNLRDIYQVMDGEARNLGVTAYTIRPKDFKTAIGFVRNAMQDSLGLSDEQAEYMIELLRHPDSRPYLFDPDTYTAHWRKEYKRVRDKSSPAHGIGRENHDAMMTRRQMMGFLK